MRMLEPSSNLIDSFPQKDPLLDSLNLNLGSIKNVFTSIFSSLSALNTI